MIEAPGSRQWRLNSAGRPHGAGSALTTLQEAWDPVDVRTGAGAACDGLHSAARPVYHRARCRVWLLDLADPGWDLDAASARLTPAERARAERGVPTVHRRRVLVRAELRRLVGDLTGLRPRDVPIDVFDGRPVVGGAGRHLRVSCSASGSVALIGVAVREAIGVDVEQLEDGDLTVVAAEGWLSGPEQATIAALPVGQRPAALTRAWVQKEAVLKARGTGLRGDPAQISTPVADAGRIGRWSVTPIPVPAGYLGCLAVAHSPLLHLRRRSSVRAPIDGTPTT